MLQTPYYLIDEARLTCNLERIAYLRDRSGAKILLALKCFATWSVFDLMRDYMDGCTSSSLYEVRLGRERFGKECHAYSVAYADHEIDAVVSHADKIIFNSIGQLQRFSGRASGIPIGLRLNPRVSSSPFGLADPTRNFSQLGECDAARMEEIVDRISGVMIHNNCDNSDFDLFDRLLGQIEARFEGLLSRMEWVSLGGGIHFTSEDYPIDALADRLKAFSERYAVQVYLEPGEAVITGSTTLETTVLDTFENGKQIAIVASSVEAHMLDLLIYRHTAKVAPNIGGHDYLVCGKSCLAADVFGELSFPHPLAVGDRVSLEDAGGYTMVKKNWFNGVNMPATAVRTVEGSIRTIREFTYDDYEKIFPEDPISKQGDCSP